MERNFNFKEKVDIHLISWKDISFAGKLLLLYKFDSQKESLVLGKQILFI